ncbi:glycine cleavage system protein H [Alicycliphilus sp. T452]|jgi:glycine cleavage system H protein
MTALHLHFPPDLHYLMEHQVWARLQGDGTATVGITALGIALSGEIYMCRPKRLDTTLVQGATVAVVELAKAIVAVKTPVSGSIVAVNPALEQRPGLVHADPYGEGWIARLALGDWAADQGALVHGDAVAAAMARHARAFGHDIAPPGAGGAAP